jgi:cysteine desulfurase
MGLSPKDIEGTLRFSFGRFNTLEETDEVIEKVAAAVNRFRKLGSFR